MNRPEMLAFVMDKIGLPIIRATTKTIPIQHDDLLTEHIAAILGETVSYTQTVSAALDLSQDDLADVNARIQLAALAARLVLLHYEKSKKPPTDKDLKRYDSALKALIGFSDSYIPQKTLSDAYQKDGPSHKPELSDAAITLKYLKHFTPLINAVSQFSFGHNEAKIVQTISQSLQKDAKTLCDKYEKHLTEPNQRKSIELSILKALIDLYVSCHTQEMARVTKLSSIEREKETPEMQEQNLWEAYNKQRNLLEVLTENILPQDHSADVEIENFDLSDEDIQSLLTDDEPDTKSSPLSFYVKKDDN